MEPIGANKENSKKKGVLLFTALAFVIIGIGVLLYWLMILRFEEYTNDAYVNGNMIELTPQVAGIVTSINVDDTDYVQEGQILIELDTTDTTLAFEKAKNELGDQVRSVVQMFLKVNELQAELRQKEAELYRAQKDYENRVNLVDIGGVSREEFEHVEASYIAAEASLEETYHTFQAAYAQVQNTTIATHPLVKRAADSVVDTYVNLQRCAIVAPANGYVTQRSVQLGEWVNPAEPLLAIVPIDELWVDANFKEVQLSKMRIGQSVRLNADMYGRRMVYQGKIIGINPGTGSVFSALPPQNATGNWIKIVQRVPVRISLDPHQLQQFPLWLGLSMNVIVDIHNTSGEMLGQAQSRAPLYKTKVYQKQREGVETISEQIIKENCSCYE